LNKFLPLALSLHLHLFLLQMSDYLPIPKEFRYRADYPDWSTPVSFRGEYSPFALGGYMEMKYFDEVQERLVDSTPGRARWPVVSSCILYPICLLIEAGGPEWFLLMFPINY
jgi:hypothetical protein